MSNETKYQVFISSTYTDLIEARSAAINTVLESYNFPVGMELFGADNDEQWTIIRELIDSSDFYILILGHRYGSISKQDGISFTEKEFDYALEKGIKLMCFVRKDNVPTLPHERDSNSENIEKLQQFREKVLTDRLCEFWDNVDDLKHKISSSLYKNMRKHGGVGWVRGNQVSGQLAEEIAKLSEENRTLREENSRLNMLANDRVPNLTLTVNGNNDEIVLKDYKLKENEYYQRPPKEEKTSKDKGVWLKEEYNEKIRLYNAEIDEITEDQIQKHNNAIIRIQKIQHTCINLNFNVVNNGNTIANIINIEVEVPENISLVDNKSRFNLKFYRNSAFNDLIGDMEFNVLGNLYLLDKKAKIFNDILIDLPISSSIDSDIGIHLFENNRKVRVEKEKLLHSRSFSLDNLYLYPKNSGEGIIKINLICAELSEPIVYEIPVRVE